MTINYDHFHTKNNKYCMFFWWNGNVSDNSEFIFNWVLKFPFDKNHNYKTHP